MTTPDSDQIPSSNTDPRLLSPYHHIVVPLDGSAFSEAALRPAAELAARAKATLHIVTVHDADGGPLLHLDPSPPSPTEALEERLDLQTYMAEVEERLREGWSVDVEIEVVEGADASDAIVDYAVRVGANLAVAATHSRGILARAFLGSEATDLVRSAPFPVILIPSDEPVPDPEETPLQDPPSSVIAALDPSGDSDDVVLAHAAMVARLWGSEIHVVQIRASGTPWRHGYMAASLAPTGDEMLASAATRAGGSEEAAVRQRLAEIAAELRSHDLDADAQEVPGADPAETLATFARSVDAGLVVVGRHDKDVLERFVLGSSSDRLARQARAFAVMLCPMERPE